MREPKDIKILIACEESQRVCSAFRERGFEAYSCDLIPTSGEHPEWHIMQDVLSLLNGNCKFKTCDGVEHKINGKWGCIIAHPPCTELSVSGAMHFEKKRADGRQRAGIEFFCKMLTADCDHVAVENPINIISGEYVEKWFPDLCAKYGLPLKPSQRIQPWMFGDNHSKTTCLWLGGLPLLKPEVEEEPELEYFEWIDGKTGRKKRQPKWYYEAFAKAKTPKERGMIRSKTFPGIARAFAEQWGKYLEVLGNYV